MDLVYQILIIVGLIVVVVATTLLISWLVSRSKGIPANVDYVNKLLPGIDCGKCGSKNCLEFAEKVANKKCDASICPLIDSENHQKIQKGFKTATKQNTSLTAVVQCKGGCKCTDKYHYVGAESCWCVNKLHDGNKNCPVACLGCGDCVKKCRFGAISISKRGTAVVDGTKCVGCGECVKACPNELIKLVPFGKKVEAICAYTGDDKAVYDACEVSCIHCNECVKACPSGAIKNNNGKIEIDEKKCIHCNKCVFACPRKVISRI